ncbi:MAG: TspO/MBR family protein [Candidatus Hydrogenedentes bacterium]|nr:TspO/MBR family protein [Candidatus Hydrogenedentota bacterium]
MDRAYRIRRQHYHESSLAGFFFEWHLIGPAFVDSLFIAGSAWFLIVWFWRTTRAGSALLIPYALWTSFASVLNLHLWILNR